MVTSLQRATAVCLVAVFVAVPGAAAEHAAVERHKSIVATAGTAMRVSNHMHFKASTCEAISIPKVIIRQKPGKGTLSVSEGVLPLRHAGSEKAQKCVGTPMRTAIVQYTAYAKASGDDKLAYDVIYPQSCRHCREYKILISVSIDESGQTQTVAAPAPSSEEISDN